MSTAKRRRYRVPAGRLSIEGTCEILGMSRASFYRHVDSDPGLRRRLDVLADPVRKRKHLDEAAVRAYAAEQLAGISHDALLCNRAHSFGVRECPNCSGAILARAKTCRHCREAVAANASL